MANFHDEAVAKTLSMALSRDITAFSCEHKRSDLVPYMKLFGIKCGFKIDKQPLLSLFASLRTWVFGSDHLPILGPALHGRELLCTWIISGKLLPPLLADAVQGIRCHLGDWMQLLQKLFEDGLDLFLGFDSTPKRSLSLDYYPRIYAFRKFRCFQSHIHESLEHCRHCPRCRGRHYHITTAAKRNHHHQQQTQPRPINFQVPFVNTVGLAIDWIQQSSHAPTHQQLIKPLRWFSMAMFVYQRVFQCNHRFHR